MANPPHNVITNIEGWELAQKKVTFTNATNDNGDFNGTGNPSDVFTVTGAVICRVFARCTTLLAGATATLEIGTTTNTAKIIAQSTATDIDANEIWHDTTPDASVELFTVATENIVIENIEALVATADISAGVIEFYCLWKALSHDGNVSPA